MAQGSSREVGGLFRFIQFGVKPALSIPKVMGRKGLYKNPFVLVPDFVEAACFLGGQPFADTYR